MILHRQEEVLPVWGVFVCVYIRKDKIEGLSCERFGLDSKAGFFRLCLQAHVNIGKGLGINVWGSSKPPSPSVCFIIKKHVPLQVCRQEDTKFFPPDSIAPAVSVYFGLEDLPS